MNGNQVVVSCVTENSLRMIAQTLRLLRSIRWFGGELSRSRIVVSAVDGLEDEARRAIEGLGAEIHIVSRFHPANPTANRLQSFAALLDAPEDLLLMLDCDMIVVQDPLPFLREGVFQAKIAPFPTVTREVFERLFAHFAMPLPAQAHVTAFTGTPTIPYYNAGMLAMPPSIARELAPAWRRFNGILASSPQLVDPCRKHMHQASLALALAETKVPRRELPAAMNYQLNATHMEPPAGYAETDPVIIHYHHLSDDEGLLMSCPYPRAQERVELFNERMRAEGVAQAVPAPAVSRPIVVLGMHRSGTSVITEVIHAMGAHPGTARDLPAPDLFNPTGFWENVPIRTLDLQLFERFDAPWTEPHRIDLSQLTAHEREVFLQKAREVSRSVTLIKDPRMSLLLPLWREVFVDPVYVIAWREPTAVAASLSTRDALPPLQGIALWEMYTRAILRETRGLPRVLVAYGDLMADPARAARELHERLESLGVRGLKLPAPERIGQSVKPDFNRSAIAGDEWLDADQLELRNLLRSGAVLEQEIPDVSARTRALVETFATNARETALQRSAVRDLGSQLRHREELLAVVFASRIWRAGNWISRAANLFRGRTPTAEERWRRR